VDIYNDVIQIGEVLYQQEVLDDTGMLKLQEAVLYVKDRLAQDHAKQMRQSVPHAHQTTAVEIISDMKFSGPRGLVDEPKIVEALARHLGYPFMRLDSLELDPDFITRTLPQKFSDRFLLLPLGEVDGKLRIAVFDPSQREVLEDVSRVCGKELEVVIAPKSDILKIILEFHGFKGSIKAAVEKHIKYFKELADLERLVEVQSLEEISHTDKNIRTAVDAMFRRAITQRASDIHIEPKRNKSLLRMRIDGVLHDIDWIPGHCIKLSPRALRAWLQWTLPKSAGRRMEE
jgi:general secretion pathway protein E